MSWTSSSNTFSNLSYNSLAFYIVFLIGSQTKFGKKYFSSFSHFFWRGSHFRLFNKSRTHTVQIGVAQLLQFMQFVRFYSQAKFTTCQNISLGNLASHVIFFPALKISLFAVHSAKLSKLSCVLRVYQCLLGPPGAELQPLLCSVNWTFGYKRLRNSRPNR